MNKAFIFDMDGVIIDSESVWPRYEEKFLPKLLGKNIYFRMKDQMLGTTLNKLYEIAKSYGSTIDKKQFVKCFDTNAKIVYKKAKIIKNIDKLIDKLVSLNFKLGLVSASRQLWIDLTLAKMKKSAAKFDYVLSVNDQGIATKPSPDCYLLAIKKLCSKPSLTIIVEDSKRGVKSAKASGAFTVCLTEHLAPTQISQEADLYVSGIGELIDKVEEIKL